MWAGRDLLMAQVGVCEGLGSHVQDWWTDRGVSFQWKRWSREQLAQLHVENITVHWSQLRTFGTIAE